MPVEELHPLRFAHLDVPYPNGESWCEAIEELLAADFAWQEGWTYAAK